MKIKSFMSSSSKSVGGSDIAQQTLSPVGENETPIPATDPTKAPYDQLVVEKLQNTSYLATPGVSNEDIDAIKAHRSPITEEKIVELFERPIASWSVNDVCSWLEAFGMGQYRMKFVHNAVDGQILTKLTAEKLKNDLQISSLGHREALMRAIRDLPRQEQGANTPGTVIDADLVSKEERIKKIRYELEKAQSKAAQKEELVRQAQGAAMQAAAQVKALEAELDKMGAMSRREAVQKRLLASVSSTVKEPKANKGEATFMTRLASDLAQREAKLAEKQQQRANDAEEKSKAALYFLKSLFDSKDGEQANLYEALSSTNEETLNAALDHAAKVLAEQLLFAQQQVLAVKACSTSAKKALKLAGIVRTCQFMQRLQNDLTTRDNRLKQANKTKKTPVATGSDGLAKETRDAKERFLKLMKDMNEPVAAEREDAQVTELAGLLVTAALDIKQPATKNPEMPTVPITNMSSALSSQATDSQAFKTCAQLLSQCTLPQLQQLKASKNKLIATHRALRTAEFLAATTKDLKQRSQKFAAAQEGSEEKKSAPLSKERCQAFLQRLLVDADRRNANLKAAQEEKLQKLAALSKRTTSKKKKGGQKGEEPAASSLNAPSSSTVADVKPQEERPANANAPPPVTVAPPPPSGI